MRPGIFIEYEAFANCILRHPAWTKTEKENVVTFSEINQSSGHFCFITLYGATPSIGTPQKDFTKEWNNLVVKPWNAEANPKTETEQIDGWTAIAGGTAIDFQGNKAFAVLSVLSGFGKTISVLGNLNKDTYLTRLRAFLEAMNIDKSSASVTSPIAEPPLSAGPSENPAPMHAAALGYRRRSFRNKQPTIYKIMLPEDRFQPRYAILVRHPMLAPSKALPNGLDTTLNVLRITPSLARSW